MILKELNQTDLIESYRQSILKRFELAQTKQENSNCHAAAYYLLGVKQQEYCVGDACWIDLNIFQIVENIKDAIAVGFTRQDQFKKNASIVKAGHIAVLHPYDKTKVIHRDLSGYRETKKFKDNFITESFLGLNPILIEPLFTVQKRYNNLNMYLLSFKSKCFNKLLIHKPSPNSVW